jgi:uncharacterized protein YbjT (DUF2867 family)
MVKQFALPATILRPTYFMQNDHIQKDALLNYGVYAMPIGGVRVSMVDIRDLAEVAALELIQRETSARPLPASTIEIVGPEIFTGESGAALWSEVLGHSIRYGGDDLDPLERRIASWNESWLAYDQVRMFRSFHRDGMIPAKGSVDSLAERLGHPLRTYRSFVEEMAKQWRG